MDCVTNISQIEKIYCNTHNHDVKAPVVYADGYYHLYADAEYTKPVDYKLLKDLFFAGVVIISDGVYARVTYAYLDGYDVHFAANISGNERDFFGYDTENDEWYKRMPS